MSWSLERFGPAAGGGGVRGKGVGEEEVGEREEESGEKEESGEEEESEGEARRWSQGEEGGRDGEESGEMGRSQEKGEGSVKTRGKRSQERGGGGVGGSTKWMEECVQVSVAECQAGSQEVRSCRRNSLFTPFLPLRSFLYCSLS